MEGHCNSLTGVWTQRALKLRNYHRHGAKTIGGKSRHDDCMIVPGDWSPTGSDVTITNCLYFEDASTLHGVRNERNETLEVTLSKWAKNAAERSLTAAMRSNELYRTSRRVKTWVGSRTEDHAVKPFGSRIVR